MTTRPGAPIGRYELVAPLGRGGTGDVWRAILRGPAEFRREVAIKVLRNASDVDRRALVGEARIGALLHHPNVVAVSDLVEHDGRWYVVMELVRGPTLGALIAAGPIPAGAVLDAGMQLCAALEHIHGLAVDGRRVGLVHRDVKPANVLVDEAGLVKLTDLGVAALAGKGGAAGTPGYVAIEVLEGRPSDHRADLFALGVVLFVLALRKRPFGGGAHVLARTRQVEGLVAGGLCAPIDDAVPGLRALVERCLARDPDDRWATAAELRNALGRLLSAQPRGATLAELVARWAGSRSAEATSSSPSSPSSPSASAPTVVLGRGNLPRSSDAFLGRETERRELAARVRARERLVVLHGLGGAGKTRLALEVARRVQPELQGGAWFVDLSDARTALEASATVGRALGRVVGADPVGLVGAALGALGPALVVLDNLEQLVDQGAAAIARWVEAAPDVVFLGTSRVALRVGAERLVPIGPLPTTDAVALFRARAPDAACPAAELAALVDALEGIPLAIELAAARARRMPVADVRRRLGERLRLLAGGDRDRPERQRSMVASLDQSWELLRPDARQALAALSVFDGGFRLDAAEAVLPETAWAVDLVQELADASLVSFSQATGRFSMPVIVREYARERADGDTVHRAERRHGRYFAQLGGRDALDALSRHGGSARWAAIAAEIDNVVAAAARALDRDDHEVALGCAAAAYVVLTRTGPMARALEVLEAVRGPALERLAVRPLVALARILDQVGRSDEAVALLERLAALVTDPDDLGSVRRALGILAVHGGSPAEAEQQFRAALALYRDVGNRVGEALVMGTLAGTVFVLGRVDEALLLGDRALALEREVGDRWAEGILLGQIGVRLSTLGRNHDAARLHVEALAVHREVGNRNFEAVALNNLATVYRDLGRTADAEGAYCEALAIHREVGDAKWAALVLGNLGVSRHDQGDVGGARACYEEALAEHRRFGNHTLERAVLGNLGNLHFELAEIEVAEDMYALALRIARGHGDRQGEAVALDRLASVALHRGALGEARLRLDEALEIYTSLGHRTDALGLRMVLARVDHVEGRHDAARAAFEEGISLFRADGDARAEGRVRHFLGETLLDLGRWSEARTTLVAAHGLLSGAHDLWGVLKLHAARAALELAEGDLTAARREVEAGLALAERANARRLRVELLRVGAEIEVADGRPEALAALRAAEAEARATASRPELARLLELRGRHHLTLGSAADADLCRAEAVRIRAAISAGDHGRSDSGPDGRGRSP